MTTSRAGVTAVPVVLVLSLPLRREKTAAGSCTWQQNRRRFRACAIAVLRVQPPRPRLLLARRSCCVGHCCTAPRYLTRCHPWTLQQHCMCCWRLAPKAWLRMRTWRTAGQPNLLRQAGLCLPAPVAPRPRERHQPRWPRPRRLLSLIFLLRGQPLDRLRQRPPALRRGWLPDRHCPRPQHRHPRLWHCIGTCFGSLARLPAVAVRRCPTMASVASAHLVALETARLQHFCTHCWQIRVLRLHQSCLLCHQQCRQCWQLSQSRQHRVAHHRWRAGRVHPAPRLHRCLGALCQLQYHLTLLPRERAAPATCSILAPAWTRCCGSRSTSWRW